MIPASITGSSNPLGFDVSILSSVVGIVSSVKPDTVISSGISSKLSKSITICPFSSKCMFSNPIIATRSS